MTWEILFVLLLGIAFFLTVGSFKPNDRPKKLPPEVDFNKLPANHPLKINHTRMETRRKDKAHGNFLMSFLFLFMVFAVLSTMSKGSFTPTPQKIFSDITQQLPQANSTQVSDYMLAIRTAKSFSKSNPQYQFRYCKKQDLDNDGWIPCYFYVNDIPKDKEVFCHIKPTIGDRYCDIKYTGKDGWKLPDIKLPF